VQLSDKAGGWITLSPLPPQPEPVHLGHLKAELGQRWPMIGLLDMLKETDLRARCTDHFTSATPREHLDRATLQKRLLRRSRAGSCRAWPTGATAAPALAVSDTGIENGLAVACAHPLVAVMNPNCGWAE